MMATEATSHNLATSSTIPEHELNTTETSSQDVPFKQPQTLVNGTAERNESKEDNAESAEAGGLSAEVSVSGGSDTEASKAETSKATGDDKGHARTASTVKKLASFKPVSVNKTFLAAKGVAPTVPSKLGEKPATSATATLTGPSTTAPNRPRLVAKTGSGLRDSSPRSSTPANGGKPATPDASAVWNKNRPVPPPDPKRFTDEELKQRYGIHLATRLQSDDPGKQANWADIDDDDDDWAPETIEWTDGTKITLPQADETPAPAPVPSPVPAVRSIEVTKPKSPAPTQASASPTVKPSGFGGRAGLVLKGASEKPTLVAKPPGPQTPVKSPWAQLPPMEKGASIAVDAPQAQAQPSQQQNRFNQRDPHGFQAMPPPPAKEIAADDFSRSWRDGHSNTSRELYNSQSGRYEPVNDNRRGSRNDIHSRQPAVLQRPSQQDGPAEPSAAFQTHRASGPDSGYGRRRTSSNVSGGSGNFIRRMSRGDMPPPIETLNARRGSLAAVSDAPSSPRNFSPSGQHQSQRGNQNQAWSRTSPATNHASPQSVHGHMAQAANLPQAVVQEDPIEEQKKIMRLRREQAIKRRQEEEAKEEAAKKERIRLKLEAMEKEHGHLPEAKKKDVPKDEKAVPTQIQTREAVALTPTQPEHKSDIESKSKISQPTDSLSASILQDAKVVGAQELPPNGVHGGSSALPAAPASHQQNNRSAQSWQNQPTAESDRFHSWAPPPAQQSGTRNVWGPPSSDRILGNGTFNPELSMASSSNPGAIGPPSRANGPYQQGRGREFTARPAPIGPPTRASGPSKEQQSRVTASGWSSLPEKLAQEDAMVVKQQAAELAHRRDLQAKGLYMDPPQPIIKDHWRQVAINEDGTRGAAQPVSLNIIDDGSATQNQEDSISRQIYEERRLDGQPQFPNDPWRSAPGSSISASPQVRGSRFFPSNNRDIRLEDPNAFLDRPGSPSPPPPTMAGHPAYDGDSAHPQVSLPRPSPVVKLPPPVLAPIGPPKPASFAAAVTLPTAPSANRHSARHDYNPRQGYQDIPQQLPPVVSGGWQDRISNLLGRKSSPPKSQALAVDSLSKNALELPTSQSFATVSLPSSVSGDLAADDGSVASKPAAEECFEEQEMGSLPVIKVPFAAPAAAWSLANPQPKSLPKRFLISNPTTVDPIAFSPHNTSNGVAVTIMLPGQQESKNVNIPATRHRGSPRRGGSSRGTSRHSGPHSRGGRARESSSGFPNASSDSPASSSPTRRGGHRGNSRGYGSNWNRNLSAPVHT